MYIYDINQTSQQAGDIFFDSEKWNTLRKWDIEQSYSRKQKCRENADRDSWLRWKERTISRLRSAIKYLLATDTFSTN